MTTIMRESFGKGGLGKSRRCDATCHNARQPHCGCICGGRYHGTGKAAKDLRGAPPTTPDAADGSE
jgi:hypothetical protein